MSIETIRVAVGDPRSYQANADEVWCNCHESAWLVILLTQTQTQEYGYEVDQKSLKHNITFHEVMIFQRF